MKIIIALICILLICPFAFAEEIEFADTTFKIFSDLTLELDPEDQPYPNYVADPRRPRMNLGIGMADSDIPETSSSRIIFDAGTRYTLFKVLTDPQGINEFALDIEAGIFTQFDPGRGLDNIGWDGQYAVFAVYDWSDTIVVRSGIHLPLHILVMNIWR